MSWEKVRWRDVLNIYNGKNQSKVVNPNGRYPIYGSGGLMGYSDDFLCPAETTIIGRKGSINNPIFVNTEFWNVDTAFGLVAKEGLLPKYLYYFCKTFNFLKLDKSTTLPSLTKSDLLEIEIPLPPLPIQEKIAAILDKADALRRKDQELLKKYDELAQAIFIDMFGDPVKNEKGWEVKRLSELGTVVTGNTPPRANDKNYGDYIEWIKTDNILLEKVYPVKAKEYLSESGSKLGRIVSSNSILVTCIAGSKKSIGNCCLTDRTVAFNQQINAFKNFDQFYKPTFLYRLFKEYQSYIQNSATDGMKKIITKSEFEKLAFIVPSLDLQETFAKKIELIHQLKAQANAVKSEELFQSLLQRAFKGELTC